MIHEAISSTCEGNFRKHETDFKSDYIEQLFSRIEYARVEDLPDGQRVPEVLGSSPFVAYLALQHF